ncbi:MAG: methyltransferase domain-containing protein [Spiroplasma sp.]|nr:methyltransferase domain-containing protein [Spiroplasma sp.]
MTNYKTLKLKIDHHVVSINQRKDMFCVSLDTILLINFIKIKNQTETLIDFGTNNGAIAILLAKKFPIKIIGIEVQKEAVELAIENIAKNNLQNQVTIIHKDIKDYANDDGNKKVDIIVCNPPFFPVLAKTNFKLAPLKIPARHEVSIDLKDIIASAAKLLKVKGIFFITYPATRVDQLLLTLQQYNFSVKRMQIVYPKINKNANRVLIEAGFKTNTGLIIEPPLICHNENNSYNSEIAKWYNKNNK